MICIGLQDNGVSIRVRPQVQYGPKEREIDTLVGGTDSQPYITPINGHLLLARGPTGVRSTDGGQTFSFVPARVGRLRWGWEIQRENHFYSMVQHVNQTEH